MVFTDSIKLYDSAVRYGRKLQEQKGYQSQVQRSGYNNGYNHGYGNNYSSNNYSSVEFEPYYIQIIATMFYELITKKCSELLSLLCAVNNIKVDVTNFSIKYKRCNFQSTYDLLPLLNGLNTAFVKNLDECSRLYSAKNYDKDIFQGKAFHQDFDYATFITDALRALDENIGHVLTYPNSSSTEQTVKAKIVKEEKTNTPEILLRIHDPKLTDKLNQLSENRKANDAAISEQIQQLQVSLQDELKQIMSIREGIDYNITQEAINQFVSLFSLVSETLQYHPNDENKDSYHNLIESCEDFLANIEQSLAMLGVTIINDISKQFDPESHKVARGNQPMRGARISRVLKIGFAYKGRVLEKAEVELA
jgi:molecular chaperone GrpE (heat shock protein)